MDTLFRSEPSNAVADQAAQTADNAIRSTQRVANQALDSMANGVQDLRHQAAPLLNRATEQVSTLAHRGVDAVVDGTHQLREKARQASDSTVTYIQHEPVKAMLFAAATGAVLMALLGLMSRSRERG
jgi:ElaB/YqjD/DUF883 family membrane-anchored ribosome-binding protein